MLSWPEKSFGRIVFVLLALACLLPFVNAGMALLLGLLVAVSIGNPYAATTPRLTKKFLAISIIGLGAGMNLITVAQAGAQGIGYTAISIAAVIVCGVVFGRLLRCERDSSFLITAGTAICGASAIAAISPVLGAKAHSISIAMAVVFVLNAVALFLFPSIGHHLGLTQEQFGLWIALAIHDTSSVVGAGMAYGPEALEIGTTVKLARALWIVPLVFAVQWMIDNEAKTRGEERGEKPKRSYPWFILGFLAMAALVTFFPILQPAGDVVAFCARRLFVLTLFLIGAGLTVKTLKSVGFRPLAQGVLLWILVVVGSLSFVLLGVVG